MLDFYTIDDKQLKPDFPEKAGLVFAGQLDEKNLQQPSAKRHNSQTI
jgi:hypothetical protein